jgi:hypothetical protein
VADFKEDPIGFLRSRLQTFSESHRRHGRPRASQPDRMLANTVDAAVLDPVEAFKTQPETGAVVGVAVATLVGMIGVCAFIRFSLSVTCTVVAFSDMGGFLRRIVLSLLAPKPKEVQKKAEGAAKKVEKVASEVKSEVKEGDVRKRTTGKGKAAPAE